MCYVTLGEIKELIESEKIEGKSDTSLQLFIDSGKELIDSYCKKSFTDPVPSIVKVVNVELVDYLLQDHLKESETIGKYSFTNNLNAYEDILKKLSGLVFQSSKQGLSARVI